MGFELPRKATPTNPLRLAILISGSGSGMAALLVHQKRLEAEGGCTHISKIVISNNKAATGLEKAENSGVKNQIITLPKGGTTQESRIKHEKLLHQILLKNDIEAVILSGYMRILSPWFVDRWEGRLLNIHPSLLPKFPGANAHRDVLNAGEEITGCTVHFVDSGMDSGRIIAQQEVKVLPGDDESTLSERVKLAEHQLYPRVIDDFSSGKFTY